MGTWLESFNQSMFLAINAGEHPPAVLYWLAWLSAEVLISVLAAVLAAAWLRGQNDTRRALVYAGLAAIVSLLINQLIGLAWYHPRPFETGLGHTLLAHKPEPSFPSDHATVFFSISLALMRWTAVRMMAVALLLVSLLVAWSRVWLGVHFPLDVFGFLLVSSVVLVTLNRFMMAASGYMKRVGEQVAISMMCIHDD